MQKQNAQACHRPCYQLPQTPLYPVKPAACSRANYFSSNGHEPDTRRAWLRAGLQTPRVLPHVGRLVFRLISAVSHS